MTFRLLQSLTLATILLFAQSIISAQTSQWRPVNGARQANISGMALVEHSNRSTSFIIVHDNKKKEQLHAAIITVEGCAAPKYTPLQWLGSDIPTDLEAISSIPDMPNNFMAFTAAGRVFHIVLDRTANSVKVIKSFDVPSIPADGDFEGFAMQKINNVLIAAWADRGLDAKPAQLFWSRFDVQAHTFAQVDSAFFKVPYPTLNTRHISDIKIDPSGAVFVTSAADPGNDGPFVSAFYFAGTFNNTNAQRFTFTQSPLLTRLGIFDYHKIEAFEFVSGTDGGVAFGTDDENLGAAIFMDW